MRKLVILLLAVVAVSALPKQSSRIVGGELTTINQYPEMAAMLVDPLGWNRWANACGGIILNNRSIITAAHCFDFVPASYSWRTRVGSTYANDGGVVFSTAYIINHFQYNQQTHDCDIAIVRIQGAIQTTPVIQYAAIAGRDYHVADNQIVWASGWGYTAPTGPASEQLRHVQIYTINQDICRQRYTTEENNVRITDNMLCSGVLDVGGRDQCFGDSGGPLYHNGVVVGVCSFGPRHMCASPWYPGVNVRVSRFTDWLIQNR